MPQCRVIWCCLLKFGSCRRLEVDENDSIGDFFKIPAVMIRKSRHDELLLEQLKMPGDRPWSILSNKEDVLDKQIMTAQKAGAKAVIVVQTRIDPEPKRLNMNVFGEDDKKAPSSSGVKIPVVSIAYDASLEGIEAEDSECRIALAGLGTLYAWGLVESEGNIENEEVFQVGYDGARQSSYQFIQEPEVVSALLDKTICHISCGEDHSAAVSNDGVLYCWGSFRDGKLETGSMDDEDIPVAINTLSSVKVARVECGIRQTDCVKRSR